MFDFKFGVDLSNFFGYPEVSFNQKNKKHETEKDNRKECSSTADFKTHNKAKSVCMDGNEYTSGGLYAFSEELRYCVARNGIGVVEALNTYTFLSANLQNFMPTIPPDQHVVLFEQFQLAQHLNGKDTTYFVDQYPLPIHGWDSFLTELQRHPGIVCTYHFGAYQLINYLLIKAKMRFALLVAGEVKAKWHRRFPHLLTALQKAEEDGYFELLDANDRSSLRRLYARLAQGFLLLIYTDGLEGIHTRKREDLQSVSFLGQHIVVPKGAAQLSYTFGLPIHPLLALRRKEHIALITGERIEPDEGVLKKSYIQETTHRLFHFLEPYLHHWPEQWTNWPHIHGMLAEVGTLLNGNKWDGDPPEDSTAYGIYCLEDRYFLLRKHDYMSFVLEKEDFEMLFDSWHRKH